MAAHPVLRFHDGRLDIPEELQRDWKLAEGSEFRVVSSSPSLILLAPAWGETEATAETRQGGLLQQGAMANLGTPEWKARATVRKEEASRNLDRVYGSGTATTTELRNAEREWEFADDELDFGPFQAS